MPASSVAFFMAHIQLTFSETQPEQQERLIAHLVEAGYEGFEEKENSLIAYIPETSFDETLLNELTFKYQLEVHRELIPDQNWNEVWESNFSPVIIGDFVGIRAEFHASIEGVRHQILITPKMSFGTGHHATTEMMVLQMRDLEFRDGSVLDFGTGTGILAILSEKLGAGSVLAIDNDDWSIENARENVERNRCIHIRVEKGDHPGGSSSFDIILANINRNIIVEQFPTLVERMRSNGSLVLSGLLVEDENEISQLGEQYALRKINCNTKGNWISIRFDR